MINALAVWGIKQVYYTVLAHKIIFMSQFEHTSWPWYQQCIPYFQKVLVKDFQFIK